MLRERRHQHAIAIGQSVARLGAASGTHLDLDGLGGIAQPGAGVDKAGKAMASIEQTMDRTGRQVAKAPIIRSEAHAQALASLCPDLDLAPELVLGATGSSER
jgi:hypothetical protein